MKYALQTNQMKELDRYTMEEVGIPACVLMEKAAMAVAGHAGKLFSKSDKLLAVCGYGNNGGDGIAAARILYREGYHVAVMMIGDRKHASKETKQQLRIAKNLGVPVMRKVHPEEYTGIIDAMFGIGLNRPVSGEFRTMIEQINASGARVISVDIPSGVCADDGKILGAAVNADVTVTFGYQKVGCLLYPGAECAGKVIVEDIGFAPLTEPPKRFYFDEKPSALLPVRRKDSHKGSYGKVLVIAGSKNMSGAAYFATAAAYRMGTGLVRVVTAQENREILQRQLPEAILTTYETIDGSLTAESIEEVKEAVAWASVILIGPGLGTGSASASLVNYVIANCMVPLVMDADALNILSRMISEKVPEEEGIQGRVAYIAKLLPAGTIITPHKKELSVLTGIPLAQLVTSLIDSSAICTYNNEIIYVKKDVRTIVSFGESDYINVTGNDGMATAGSGDVLGGMIAGLLAQGETPKMAAMSGCYLHGMAGDVAACRKGTRSMLASDMLEAIPVVLLGAEPRV
ncbi:MAG: NAD(P)H-hydrate dehydratase [Lachnospiraceae bacterium]